MNRTKYNRRLIENEAVFRNWNESVYGLDGDSSNLKLAPATVTEFFCECSDENCSSTISLSVRTYGKIHEDRNCFIVIPGHEVDSIESVVTKRAGYTIVQKYETPSENPEVLAKTDVHN